jgi:hypothetical protein
LAALSRERDGLRAERGNLLALLNSTQSLLEQQSARITMLQRVRTKTLFVPAKASARVQAAKLVRRSADRVSVGQARPKRKGSKARKLKRGR